MEKDPESWHSAPIYGHSESDHLFLITHADYMQLQLLGINVLSQIYEVGVNGTITNNLKANILQLPNMLCYKIQRLKQKVWMEVLGGSYPCPLSAIKILMSSHKNISSFHKKQCLRNTSKEIKKKPAYCTRIADNVPYPDIRTFTNAYLVAHNSLLP